jgi:hypothetical protein
LALRRATSRPDNASIEAGAEGTGESSHLWQAALPRDLGAGTHRITVRAVDEYGRNHLASMVLAVTA